MINLAPLTFDSPLIQAHVYAARAAVGVGAAQFARPKGVLSHRTLGYVWAALTLTLAGSSLFTSAHPVFGPLSPIHTLSFFVLVQTPLAVCAARRGRIASHRGRCSGCMRWR